MVKTSFSYLENRSNVQYVPEALDFSPSPASPFYLFLLPGCFLLCYGPVGVTPIVPKAFALLVFKSHLKKLTCVCSCT